MEVITRESVFYCKDCGRLDYAQGVCPKCKSRNIVRADHDFLMGYGTHIQMMRSLYEQHYEPDHERRLG